MFLLNSFSPTSFAPISWAPGDESWVPEEELRPEYRGSGRQTLPPRQIKPRRQFDDATDQDIRDLVEARWELEELRQQRGSTPTANPAPQPKLVPAEEPAQIGRADQADGAPTSPTPAAPAIATDTDRPEKQERARKRQPILAMAILLSEVD